MSGLLPEWVHDLGTGGIVLAIAYKAIDALAARVRNGNGNGKEHSSGTEERRRAFDDRLATIESQLNLLISKREDQATSMGRLEERMKTQEAELIRVRNKIGLIFDKLGGHAGATP